MLALLDTPGLIPYLPIHQALLLRRTRRPALNPLKADSNSIPGSENTAGGFYRGRAALKMVKQEWRVEPVVMQGDQTAANKAKFPHLGVHTQYVLAYIRLSSLSSN